MEVIKKQRLAVCRILLDVVEGACEVRDPDLIMRARHYPPHGAEIRKRLAEIIGEENCYFF